MSDLLIHSMAEFSSIILPCLDEAGVRDIAEIGSEFGGMSRLLAERCEQTGGQLTCIDPAPASGFADWAEGLSHVEHIAALSLSALQTARAQDAWFIDGDHNYYTVLHELVAIDALQRAAGRPLLAFVHDVSWPCARRDFYYAPERIPAQWRHPHSFDHGVRLESDRAFDARGLRGMGHFAVALEAGGARNGVLTALEDFLKDADTDERPLCYVHIPAVLGLGIIFDASTPWAEPLAQWLRPYHANALIARLEENRLRNYLEVIDWQDRRTR